MIASPSIAFNDFSGSANDVTARQSKGRTVLTVKPRPTGAFKTARGFNTRPL